MALRVVTEMLETLVSRIEGDELRQENVWRSHSRACEVGRRLPLVHRTCKPGAETLWHAVLNERKFAAREPCTDREKAVGIPRAAYFFVGCGAYPDGLVGFVLDAPSVLARPASFTPFDSGSIEKYSAPADPAALAGWDGAAKDRFLAEHVGAGSDVPVFAGPYLSSHFRDAYDYVRRPQHATPDFAAYHGLSSGTGDRRAWTIEVQVHEDVTFGVGDPVLVEIVAARQSLVEELPDDLVGLARVAIPENEVLENIGEGIASRILSEVP
jgi:hypothetical protein